MHERVTSRIRARRAQKPEALGPRERLEILPYRPAWRPHFEELNRAWLEKTFTVEAPDAALLFSMMMDHGDLAGAGEAGLPS
jgi:hypothetical protein